ncbi:TetR family transcriptional regulator [Spirillospora sp. CA-294931]|uniref:TetR family transcriptional regulator n=1 Tax=Spirillospora sp. CA-294931 TaxID=3240042 RepID=UPI003D92AFB3
MTATAPDGREDGEPVRGDDPAHPSAAESAEAGPVQDGDAAEPPPGSGRALAGLRERKKQRTRMALIDAALDLFLEKGYDATTIDEIVAAVEVSQRTFFRYFATKEDVVTGFLAEHDQVMMECLAGRSAGEPPLTALFESLREMMESMTDASAEAGRFRRIHQVIEANPPLLAAQMARYAQAEKTLAAEIARRLGVDPEDDPRPQIIVAIYSGSARVVFEDCARKEIWDVAIISERMERVLTLTRDCVRDWV